MSNMNPFPQGGAKYELVERIGAMTDEQIKEFCAFLMAGVKAGTLDEIAADLATAIRADRERSSTHA